jgi:NitT/TauT family transport system substrate-binding protein
MSNSSFVPSRGQFVRTCAAVAASLGVARPAFAQNGAATPLVVGVLPTPDVAGVLYGRSQNTFAPAGLDVELQTMQSGADILAAAVGGSVQIGFADSYTLIQAFQHGIPLRLISPGGLYQSTAPSVKVLVHEDSSIKSAKDLAGKTLGGTLHNILGLSVNAWLMREGVDPASVHLLTTLPSLTLTAFQARRVDAIVTFEPFLSAAEALGARVIGTPFDAIAPAFLASSWFGIAPWVTDHRSVVKTFTTLMTHNAAYVNAHYQEMIPMLAEFSKLTPESLSARPQSKVPPALVPAQLQPVIDTAAKFHWIPAAYKAENMMLT